MTRGDLRRRADALYKSVAVLTAEAYDAEAAIAHMDGDDLRAELYAAIRDATRDVPGAMERVQRANEALTKRAEAENEDQSVGPSV